MTEESKPFRLVPRPEGVSSPYAFIVVGRDGMPSLALTTFVSDLQQDLTDGAVRTYVNALLPYFTYLETDPWRRQRVDRWDGPPEVVRESVRDYLMLRLGCKVRLYESHTLVKHTAQSPATVRVFLATLKRFYSSVLQSGWYGYEHPLLDAASSLLKQAQAGLQKRPRMPAVSGIEPVPSRYPSENYFHLVGDEWQPQALDDPDLPRRLLEAARRIHFPLRDQIIVRIAYESGARISEILGLTVGDWRARGCRQEALACSKGSRGRRVKFLRFSPETAKLLHSYVNGERQQLDAQQHGLAELLDTDSLFLSARQRAYGYKAFVPHWRRLCQAASLSLPVHGLRHWHTTQAIGWIYEQSSSSAEIERRKEEFVQYMAWRSPETLKSYEHYVQAHRFVDVLDQIHARLSIRPASERPSSVSTVSERALTGPSLVAGQEQRTDGVEQGWDSVLALGGG